MTKLFQKYRSVSILLLFVLLIQACAQVKLEPLPALPTAQDIEPASGGEIDPFPTSTATATIEIPVPTKTEILPAATSSPKVTLHAVKGNLFIRRGPDMAFNPVGVLYKDTSANVIARDVLSNWVQVEIPNSDKTGWVSIQTEYSQIVGEIKDLPEFTPTEWPVAAYLRNCTYHQMYIMPNEIVLPSYWEYPDNEIWIYPGTYTIYDIDVSGDPEVDQVTVGEGSTIEILDDGLGKHRKCP
jgi:hypothetical protein